MHRSLGFLLIVLTAVPILATFSTEYKEWGTGPAQWIMTPDEQRAWRKIATDDEAIAFIDLFWVRRDPTPGTAVNEFRGEFESRVAFSDERFSEKRKRGAMTDRGRVYIVLGPGTTMEGVAGQSLAQMGVSESSDDSSLAHMGMNYLWTWKHADARKFDMPKIEVGFVQDPVTKKVQRDPRRPDFGRAAPNAIRKAIVNPDLTSVPEWAATGGLKPVARVIRTETVMVPVPSVQPENDGPAVASDAPGVSRLTLLPRGWINPRSPGDPFAVAAATTFKAGQDLTWAVQVCSSTAEVPRLKYMLLISGPKEQRTREKDAKLERMTALPGCYVVQATAPVSNLGPGAYKLTVYLDSATGDSHTVKGDFRLE